MRKLGILVLIGVLSWNSIGLAAKKSKKTKVDTITNTNNENSKSKKSIFRKLLKKKDDDSWELVWNDEFDGDTLDLSKWSYWENDNPSKNGNYVDENGNWVDEYGFSAKQYYLADNMKVENGNLVIEVKKEDNKTVKINGIDRKILYSSGAIHSKDKYNVKYGKIELRAIISEGVGVWPAFWTCHMITQ
jgi:glucan endo-1,3-beta-glucosidase A1